MSVLLRRASLLVLWTLLSAALAGFAHASEPIVIPTEECRDFFMVRVQVGEEASPERTLELLYDTGASYTIVDQGALERVTGKRVAKGKRVRIRDARSGPASYTGGLRATVMDLSHLTGALGASLDGILGYDVFGKKYLVTLDYPNRTLSLRKGRLSPGERSESSLVQKLEKSRSGRPFIVVEIDGRRRPLLIDSGSSNSLVLHDRPRLEWSEGPFQLRAAMRLKGIELGELGRLANDVELGGQTLQRPIVSITDGDSQLIGDDVLQHYRITFDFQRRLVEWARAEAGPVDFEAYRGTGALFHPRQDFLEVLSIVPGSPAVGSGLETGDRISRVNGRSISELGCGDLGRMHDAAKVKFWVERGEGGFEVEIPVVDLVP